MRASTSCRSISRWSTCVRRRGGSTARCRYDGTHPGKTIWDRMRPLGVQWGNDHESFPAVPKAKSKPLRETLLSRMHIPEHYGCGKRLAGVVDQANSSCVSCHMGAYAPPPRRVSVCSRARTSRRSSASAGMCTEFNQATREVFLGLRVSRDLPREHRRGRRGDPARLVAPGAGRVRAIRRVQEPSGVPRTCPDAGAPSAPATRP